MTPDQTRPVPLGDDEDHEMARLLRQALDQEAEMVHPDDRLGPITQDIEGQERRRWVPALLALGAVAAVALVAGLAFGLGGDDDDVVPPAATSSTSPAPTTDTPTAEPTETEPSPTEEPAPTGDALPLYWVGEQGSRFALFREFGEPGPDDAAGRVQAAVDEVLGGSPADPDYATPWAQGSGATTSLGDGEIAVDLDATAAGSSMGSELAVLAVQQLVWTVTAAAQQDVPVRFTVEGEAADLFGTVSTADPVSRGRGPEDPRALVWITEPAEGATVGTDPELAGEGVNAFENTLVWTLELDGAVVDEGFFGVDGPDGAPVDTGERGTWTLPLQGLEPGSYTFTLEVPDASDGESTFRHVDTKSFTVG